jgi:toxin ParE1/3/4
MKRAVLSQSALRDLLTAAKWIAEDNPSAAQAFRESVSKAAVRIGEHAQLGTSRPDLAGEPYRLLVLAGFPYLIVYHAERRPPLIVRILHTARDLPEALRGL